jgi:hypothetical protein
MKFKLINEKLEGKKKSELFQIKTFKKPKKKEVTIKECHQIEKRDL